MTGQQRRDLPLACRDLSALLTTERDGLARPYWTSPRLTSAYLRYFGDVSAAVKAYIKENKTDFTDREDLVALFQYCAERDMEFHGEQAKR